MYCVFCGVESKTTIDHIPPKCLFPKPRPTDLITVPACINCNNNSTLDDEYFLYTLLIALQKNSYNQKFMDDRLEKLLKKPSFLFSIMDNFIYASVHYNGIYIGMKNCFRFSNQRIQKVIDKIVRGLYYKNTTNILPKNIIISRFESISPYNFNSMKNHEKLINYLPIKDIDDGEIFSYKYYINSKNNLESLWYLMFFDQVLFMATTREI